MMPAVVHVDADMVFLQRDMSAAILLYEYGKEGNICRNLEISHGHTDISVTLNVYTHLKLADAEKEIKRLEKEHMIKR